MGTHPIFESDFDCLTDEESSPNWLYKLYSLCAASSNLQDVSVHHKSKNLQFSFKKGSFKSITSTCCPCTEQLLFMFGERPSKYFPMVTQTRVQKDYNLGSRE